MFRKDHGHTYKFNLLPPIPLSLKSGTVELPGVEFTAFPVAAVPLLFLYTIAPLLRTVESAGAGLCFQTSGEVCAVPSNMILPLTLRREIA